MPPKKKTNVTKNNQQGQNPPAKTTTEQPKKQLQVAKQAKQHAAQQKPIQVKKQINKPQEKKPVQSTLIKTESETNKKINLGDVQKLSEAELLQRRKLRFNLVGTQVNAEQAQRLTKQRMEKFGSSVPESKQDLQKRKQKFSSTGLLNINEDQATVEKRRQKFGAIGGAQNQAAQDPSIVQQRKKKFGSNDISLDQQIKKTKQRSNPLHKNHDRRQDNFKRSKPHNHHSRDHYNSHNKKFKR